ncbi:MAG: site-2 protease family protein [Candidatus Rokuibacteriota bacterium]
MEFTADRIFIGLTAYVVLLFSLSFHESAHAWTAFRLGDDTAQREGRISLNPLVHIDPIGTVLLPLVQFITGIPTIGWAKPTPVEARNFRAGWFGRGQVLVAGAGPVSNIVLCLLFTIFMVLAVKTRMVTSVDDFAYVPLFVAIQLNAALAIFNLLPIPPLDGSWVASWGLPRSLGERYDRFVEPLSGVLLLILFIPLGRYVVGPLSSWVTESLLRLVFQL